MKAYDIIGGWAHICDCCQKDDGRPTYYWPDKDFDLCLECIEILSKKPLIGLIPGREPHIIITRKSISEELRNKIFERDGRRCTNVNCRSKKDLQIDHKIPFSKGGTTTYNNLQTLCKRCNLKKRNQSGRIT